MERVEFQWDDNKADINIEKHGITFEEACTVFEDPQAILFDDPDHSEEEDRFLIVGFSEYSRMLIVSHCYRGKDEIIRIISARKATKSESQQYTKINKSW